MVKAATIIGLVGALALSAVTASDARIRRPGLRVAPGDEFVPRCCGYDPSYAGPFQMAPIHGDHVVIYQDAWGPFFGGGYYRNYTEQSRERRLRGQEY